MDKSLENLKKTLNELLNEMKLKMQENDLSEDYLNEHDYTTREEMGMGEYSYGITTVPCEWVYGYLVKLKDFLDEGKIGTKINQETIDWCKKDVKSCDCCGCTEEECVDNLYYTLNENKDI